MNRQQRRSLKHTVGKEISKGVDLFLKMPTECLTCKKKFDRKDREHAMTWHVEVFSEEQRVSLFCPECWKETEKVREYLDGNRES